LRRDEYLAAVEEVDQGAGFIRRGGSSVTKDVDERHLQLLGVLDELARADPADAAATNTAAQEIGLDTIGKEAERQAFMELVRALEEAGYAKVEGTNQAASLGAVYVTEKGRRRLRTSYGQLDSSAKRTSSLRRPALRPVPR
jgi:hypothetical protein